MTKTQDMGDAASRPGLALADASGAACGVSSKAAIPIAFFPPGEPCASCAIRPGTDANRSPETVATLKECIASGEPFYCHESTAVRDPDGFATDRHGNTYRRLPHARWRLCRGWTLARARGIEAEGRDPKGLGAEHESPVAEGDAPNPNDGATGVAILASEEQRRW